MAARKRDGRDSILHRIRWGNAAVAVSMALALVTLAVLPGMIESSVPRLPEEPSAAPVVGQLNEAEPAARSQRGATRRENRADRKGARTATRTARDRRLADGQSRGAEIPAADGGAGPTRAAPPSPAQVRDPAGPSATPPASAPEESSLTQRPRRNAPTSEPANATADEFLP